MASEVYPAMKRRRLDEPGPVAGQSASLDSGCDGSVVASDALEQMRAAARAAADALAASIQDPAPAAPVLGATLGTAPLGFTIMQGASAAAGHMHTGASNATSSFPQTSVNVSTVAALHPSAQAQGDELHQAQLHLAQVLVAQAQQNHAHSANQALPPQQLALGDAASFHQQAIVPHQHQTQDLAAVQALALAPLQGQGHSCHDAATLAYNQVYALAQLAEESAQMAASSAAFCATPMADPLQITAVAEAAQVASQRASWAVSAMVSLEEQQAPLLAAAGRDAGWLPSMMQVARQACDAAEQAAHSCRQQASAVEGIDALKPRQSKVPCKNFLAGRCSKGLMCEFSHDPADREARPLMLKSLKPCIFFAKGNCTRGPACPFAHGEEERMEIEKFVDSLKKEKRMLGKGSHRL